jgi:superfamily II DNA or RNA helicase
MSNFFDVIAYTISMQELIDQDFLVEPELKLIDFDVDDPSRLCTHLMHLYGSHRGQKGVVYLRTIQECLDFRNIFLGLGIKCEAVTSLLSGEKRDEILGGFRTNDTEILLTVDVLTAGVDFPSLQLLFMPYKVNSVTTYLQRVGRGLRPSYGKTKCTIYAGSFSPGVTKGFWEKVHKQILEQGRREYDDYLEEWEYSKETLNRQRYEWLERHIKFLKNIKEKGMDNIFNAARKKNFPKALLQDLLMNVPHNVYAGKALASEAQLKWVRQYLPEVPATLTKNEASGLIKSFKRMKGEIVPEQDIIQMGRFKGRQYDEVPQVYYHKLGQKNMRDPILVAYREHKRRIARKIELSKLNKIQGTPVV